MVCHCCFPPVTFLRLAVLGHHHGHYFRGFPFIWRYIGAGLRCQLRLLILSCWHAMMCMKALVSQLISGLTLVLQMIDSFLWLLNSGLHVLDGETS